jgi:hypothetical protein
LPGIIEPNDSAFTYLLREEAERQGIDIFRPVVAWIRLSTGELVRSEGHPLMRR